MEESFPGPSHLAKSNLLAGLSHNQFHATSCSESHSFGTRERKDDSITALDGSWQGEAETRRQRNDNFHCLVCGLELRQVNLPLVLVEYQCQHIALLLQTVGVGDIGHDVVELVENQCHPGAVSKAHYGRIEQEHFVEGSWNLHLRLTLTWAS